jgi:hypothetical protein
MFNLMWFELQLTPKLGGVVPLLQAIPVMINESTSRRWTGIKNGGVVVKEKEDIV